MLTTSTFSDVANPDGSVTRTTTVSYVNGDTDVKTHTFNAQDYLALQNRVTAQVASLQAIATQMSPIAANVTATLAAASNPASPATPASPANPAPANPALATPGASPAPSPGATPAPGATPSPASTDSSTPAS